MFLTVWWHVYVVSDWIRTLRWCSDHSTKKYIYFHASDVNKTVKSLPSLSPQWLHAASCVSCIFRFCLHVELWARRRGAGSLKQEVIAQRPCTLIMWNQTFFKCEPPHACAALKGPFLWSVIRARRRRRRCLQTSVRGALPASISIYYADGICGIS